MSSTRPRRPPRLPLHPIATFSGMVLFISAVAAYPRISITRSPFTTTITYTHHQTPTSTPRPSDPGIILTPDLNPVSNNKSTPSTRAKPPINRENLASEWIFDTGATSHVCCDAKLMHSTTSFAHSALAQAVSHFGPNPIAVRGIGDVTLRIPRSGEGEEGEKKLAGKSGRVSHLFGGSGRQREQPVGRLTIGNVSYIPDGGVNLISWSQLKRSRGLKVGLREAKDGRLEVWDVGKGQKVMSFVLRGGLYFLEQGGEQGEEDER